MPDTLPTKCATSPGGVPPATPPLPASGAPVSEPQVSSTSDDRYIFSERIISAQRTSADPERAHSRSPGRDSRSRSRSGSRSHSPDYDHGTVELPETSA